VDVYFAPERPEDARNFIQTIPNKGWNAIFRLYGPLDPWFDKTGGSARSNRFDEPVH